MSAPTRTVVIKLCGHLTSQKNLGWPGTVITGRWGAHEGQMT